MCKIVFLKGHDPAMASTSIRKSPVAYGALPNPSGHFFCTLPNMAQVIAWFRFLLQGHLINENFSDHLALPHLVFFFLRFTYV